MNISLAYCSCNLPSQNRAGVSFRYRLLMLVIFPFFKDIHGYTIMLAHAFYFFFRHGTLLLHPLLKPSGIIAEKYRSFFYWSCHNCFPFFVLSYAGILQQSREFAYLFQTLCERGVVHGLLHVIFQLQSHQRIGRDVECRLKHHGGGNGQRASSVQQVVECLVGDAHLLCQLPL